MKYDIPIRVDDSTPEKRMLLPLQHVRCEECDACQEWIIDPPAAPFCVIARVLVRFAGGDVLGARTMYKLYALDLVDDACRFTGRLTDRAHAVLRRALRFADHAGGLCCDRYIGRARNGTLEHLHCKKKRGHKHHHGDGKGFTWLQKTC